MTNGEDLMDIIASEIYEQIDDYKGEYLSELPHLIYNQDYYIIGIYEATQFVKAYLEESMDALKKYQENFGEPYPDVDDMEKLASLTMLMKADDLMMDLDIDNSNDIIDDEIIEEIKDKLEAEYDI